MSMSLRKSATKALIKLRDRFERMSRLEPRLEAKLVEPSSRKRRDPSFGFVSDVDTSRELRFLMLAQRALSHLEVLTDEFRPPAVLSPSGRWCWIITRVLRFEPPFRHDPWGSSVDDSAQNQFHLLPDVYVMSAEAIDILLKERLPRRLPGDRDRGARQAVEAKSSAPKRPTLSPKQQQIWKALEGRCLSERELHMKAFKGQPYCDGKVRKHIAKIRMKCYIINLTSDGYVRPDAPPTDE